MEKSKLSSDNELAEIFIKAAEIPSPSGKESRMARWVMEEFKQLGWKTWDDGLGSRNGSDSGSVYSYLEVDSNFPTLVFSAHLDTVQGDDDQIKVRFDDKFFRSSGNTILGADNKAGVTTLIKVAREIDKSRLNSNLIFYFPTREESGVMGSSLFNPGIKNIKYIFNVDNSDTPGVFVCKALGFLDFEIEVTGKAAHAAKEYEKGKNAIVIAAELVLSLPIGKDLKKGSTFNIGTVAGGTKTNMVCDNVILKGELRAFTEKTIDELKKTLVNRCSILAKKHKTEIGVTFKEDGYTPPFSGTGNASIIRVCKSACSKLKIKPVFETSYTSSDANNYAKLGIPVISTSRGGQNPHTKEERLALHDLINSVDLVHKLIEYS